jgi:hypothetical protein
MNIRLTFFAPALLTLAWACSSTPATPTPGDADASPSDDAGKPDLDGSVLPDVQVPDAAPPLDVAAAVAAYDAELAAAVCGRFDACCTDADRKVFYQQFKEVPYDLKTDPTPAECVATLTTQFGKLHNIWATSAAKGRIAFNPARAKQCVADTTAAACGISVAKAIFNAKCFDLRDTEVFTKLQPIGGDCNDIKDGTFYGECDKTLGYCGSSGKCEAWKLPGEPCSVSPIRQFCGPKTSCPNATPAKPGTCTGVAVEVKIGEECSATSVPEKVCPETAFCDYFGTKKCIAKAADGEACKTDFECINEYPYSCSPFQKGKCGSNAYCTGPR